MFWRQKEPDPLEETTRKALRDLVENSGIPTEEFVQRIDRLTKVLEVVSTNQSRRRVSKDTLAIVGANLLGIAMILKHEWLNPVNSKAMGILLKPRLPPV